MLDKKDKAYVWGISMIACMFAMKTFILGKYFSVDDYSLFYNQSVDMALADMSQHMRIVSDCVLAVLNICGINIVERQRVFGIFLLVAFAWAITRIFFEIYFVLYSNVEEKIIWLSGPGYGAEH